MVIKNIKHKVAHFIKHCNKTAYQGAPAKTRMWANAQRDGRAAEYRRHSLFNAANFG